MGKLVDRTYGGAFFELSLETGKMDEYAEEIRMIQYLFKMENRFMELLNHPQISQKAKEDMLTECFKARVSEDVFGFLMVILQAHRQESIMEIFDEFLGEVRKYKHIGKALVTSALELTDAQKKAIEKKLLETTENVAYEMEFSVDKSLIGGMKIRIDDIVVDGSVKHQLQTMTRELEKIQLD